MPKLQFVCSENDPTVIIWTAILGMEFSRTRDTNKLQMDNLKAYSSIKYHIKTHKL